MRMESGSLIDANVTLRSRVDQLEKALMFYQKGNHYKVKDGKTILLDNGGVAQTALDDDMAALDEAIAEGMHILNVDPA